MSHGTERGPSVPEQQPCLGTTEKTGSGFHAATARVLAGGSFALAGFLVAAAVRTQLSDQYGYAHLPFAAGGASFAVAWWCWRETAHRVRLGDGALRGALVGSASHCLTWYFMIVDAFVRASLGDKSQMSLGEMPMNPILAIAGALVYSFFSLLVVGWVTVPGGAALGAMLSYINRKSLGRTGGDACGSTKSAP